jgi:hypothetical protein
MGSTKQDRSFQKDCLHEKCYGSHQRVSNEEAEDESEVVLQDLSEIQPTIGQVLNILPQRLQWSSIWAG